MALSRVTVWNSGDTLTAADLNGEFNNILNNAITLISPLTADLDVNTNKLILDTDDDTSIRASSDDIITFQTQGQDTVIFDGATASADNGFKFVMGAAAPGYIHAEGSDANLNFIIRCDGSGKIQLSDENGDEILLLDGSGTPVNEIAITSANTGSRPVIASSGDDTDIGIDFENEQGETMLSLQAVASGAENVEIVNGTQNPIIRASGGDLLLDAVASQQVIVRDSSGNEIAIFDSVASALNEITIKNAATGANAIIQSSGESDRGIDLLDSNSNEALRLTATNAATEHVQITNSTSGGPLIDAVGSTNTNLRLNGEGTGTVDLGDATMSFPNSDGSAGQPLITNGSGTMSFGTATYANQGVPLPRGHIGGLQIATNTTSITIGAGQCRGGTNLDQDLKNLVLSSDMTKTFTDWTAGSGNGSHPDTEIGSSAGAGWYHVFVIEDGSGTVDAGIDTAVDATNLLTEASYTNYRRIGSILLDATPNVIDYTQIGDDFIWATPVDEGITAADTNARTAALTVAPDVKVKAWFNASADDNSSNTEISFYSPDATVAAPSNTNGLASMTTNNTGGGNDQAAGQFWVWTSTSRTIGYRAAAATNSTDIGTLGWHDTRGKND